jgi:hypothetical protein
MALLTGGGMKGETDGWVNVSDSARIGLECHQIRHCRRAAFDAAAILRRREVGTAAASRGDAFRALNQPSPPCSKSSINPIMFG